MGTAFPERETARQLYDRFEEQVDNEGNVEAIDTLIAEDFTPHAPIDTSDERKGYEEFIRPFEAAFPDSTSATLERRDSEKMRRTGLMRQITALESEH